MAVFSHNEHVMGLKERQRQLVNAQEALLNGICLAHDDGGLTFREIAEALGRTGYGAIHHLYTKGKARGY